MDDTTRRVAEQLGRVDPKMRSLQVATVTNVSGSTLTVRLGTGVEIPNVRRLAAYSAPAIGDKVLLIGTGPRFVLGALA